MLLPYRTDAPVYHLPWATIGIIAVNILIHVLFGGDWESIDPFILHFGTFNPLEWLSSAFAHAGWMHLLGNMLFLWVFGLVVEGKIGWWRFLAIYGAIALASGCIDQSVMLWADKGGALGASGVIYGLIAIAMVWAPENEIDCLLLIGIGRHVELPIKAFAGLYLVLQFLEALLGGMRMSTPVLHLVGAAAGLPVGLIMLKRGWVDCEGWDWFSRRTLRQGGKAPEKRKPAGPAPAKAAVAEAPSTHDAEVAAANRETFAELVQAGSLDAALALWRNAGGERLRAPLAQRERLAVGLIKAARADEAKGLVQGILAEDPGHPAMGLVQAQWLLKERRPARAREVLAALAPRLAAGRQQELHARLLGQADALERAGVLEMDA